MKWFIVHDGDSCTRCSVAFLAERRGDVIEINTCKYYWFYLALNHVSWLKCMQMPQGACIIISNIWLNHGCYCHKQMCLPSIYFCAAYNQFKFSDHMSSWLCVPCHRKSNVLQAYEHVCAAIGFDRFYIYLTTTDNFQSSLHREAKYWISRTTNQSRTLQVLARKFWVLAEAKSVSSFVLFVSLQECLMLNYFFSMITILYVAVCNTFLNFTITNMKVLPTRTQKR